MRQLLGTKQPATDAAVICGQKRRNMGSDVVVQSISEFEARQVHEHLDSTAVRPAIIRCQELVDALASRPEEEADGERRFVVISNGRRVGPETAKQLGGIVVAVIYR